MSEKPKNGTGGDDPSQQKKNYTTPEAIVTLKDALIKEETANRDQEGKEDRWNKVISIATLFFVFCTTGGIFYQDIVLNSSDKAAHQAAGAAIDSATAAKNSVTAANRAWLTPSTFEFLKPIEAEGGPDIMAHYRNVGRFPALDVKIGIAWQPFPLTKDFDGKGFPEIGDWPLLDFTSRINCETINSAIGADSVFPFENVERNAIATRPKEFTATERADVTARRKIIIVLGCFTYRTFEELHHTGFCRFAVKERTGQWELVSCPAGNFAN
jgi:hypothetical protein